MNPHRVEQLSPSFRVAMAGTRIAILVGCALYDPAWVVLAIVAVGLALEVAWWWRR